MPKGAYKVSDNYVGPSKDGSFRSCLCAMLIFAAICGSILLIAHLVTTSGSKKKESNTGDSLGTADERKGNKLDDPKNNEALKPVMTTTKKPVKLHNTTKGPEILIPKEFSTVSNEADLSVEDVDGVVTQDPSARSGKLLENNETNVVTPKITDNSEEKPGTAPIESTTKTIVNSNKYTTKPPPDEQATEQKKDETSTITKQTTATAEQPEEPTTTTDDKQSTTAPIESTTKTTANSNKYTTKPPADEQATEQKKDETSTTITKQTTATAGQPEGPTTTTDDKQSTTAPIESTTKTTANSNKYTTKPPPDEQATEQKKDETSTTITKQTTATAEQPEEPTTTTDDKQSTTAPIESTTKTTANSNKYTTKPPPDEQATEQKKDETSTTTTKQTTATAEQPEEPTSTPDDEQSTTAPIESTTKTTANSNKYTTKPPPDEQATEQKKDETSTTITKQTTATAEQPEEPTSTPDHEQSTTAPIESTTKTTANSNKYTTKPPPDEQATEQKKDETSTTTTKQTTATAEQPEEPTTTTDDKQSTTAPIESTTKTTANSNKYTTKPPPDEQATEQKKDETSTTTTKQTTATAEQPEEPTTTTDDKQSTTAPIESTTKTTANSNKYTTKPPPDEQATEQKKDETSTTTTKQTTATAEQPEEPTTTTDDKQSTTAPIESTTKTTANSNKYTTKPPPDEQATEQKKDETSTTITKQTTATAEQPEEPTSTPDHEQSTTAPIESTTKTTANSNKYTTKPPPDEQATEQKKDETSTTITKQTTATAEQPEEPTTTTDDEQSTTAPIESTTKKATPRFDYSEADDVDRQSTSNPDDHSNPCDLVCMKSVARIFTRMNHSGDACEDFYDYACGGDSSDNTLEDHWRKIAAQVEKINEKSSKAQKTFKNFYDKCVDFQLSYDYAERINQALNLISRVNQSVEEQDNDKAALTDLLTRLLQIDSSPLFDISVDVDKTSQRFAFQLNIGKRFSAIMNNYVTQKKCLYQSKKHLEFSISLFNHLDLNDMYKVYFNCQKNYTYNTNVIEDALYHFFRAEDFEEEEWPSDNVEIITEYFKKAFTPARIRKDIVTKNFQYMKVADLNFNYRMIDWKLLLQKLAGQDISEETLVQVYFPDFFTGIFKILANLQSGRKVREAILGMFAYDLYTNFVLPMPVANLEEFCLKQSVDLMPEIASSFYLDSFTPDDVEKDQKRIENIFDTMKDKLANLIEISDWADAPTENAMKTKVNNMTLKTWNGALVWQNDTLLDERMEIVTENYEKYSDFKAVLNRRKQQMTFNMWNTSCYTDENIWWYFSKPYDTQPAIIYASDLIVVPAGMLFTKSNHLPRYLSLVKLGFSLGKAIGHHFDYIGSKYNISLQKGALAAYKESEKCTDYFYKEEETKMEYGGKSIKFKVEDQYIGLSIIERFVVQISLNLITSLLNEEKNDYEISYFKNSEFDDNFKPEKLFFIALGQEHCTKPNVDDFLLALFESEHLPPALLLNKALINSDEFSKTFNCREGSGINKIQKCPAFPELEKDDTFYEEYK